MGVVTLAAKVAVKVIMVWSTVSTTTPAPMSGSPQGYVYAVYRPTMCNQVGEEYSVTTADVEWQGKTVTVELDRQPTGKTEQRAIDCNGIRE